MLHYKFGGSTATRQLECPAWSNLAKKAPDIPRESAAATRGTMLHQIMEDYYQDAEVDIGALCKDLNQKDRDAIDYAVNMTESMLDRYDVKDYLCESTMKYDEDIGSTADMLATGTYAGKSVLIILDYKFGRQKVERTDQFTHNMMCGREDPKTKQLFDGVEMLVSCIVQPEVSQEPLYHNHTWEELEAWEDKYLDTVELTDQGVEDGKPGEWCHFCPAAAANCPAKRASANRFLEIDATQAEGLSQAMLMVADMKALIKAVETEANYNLEAGLPVEGFKLVDKRGKNHWIDEGGARTLLAKTNKTKKEDYLNETLKTAPQVLAMVKKKGLKMDLSEYISNASTGTTMVPVSDKRPQVFPGQVPKSLDAILDKG
tara:strand:+ start:459 stop:1580 length:1122 start_codon:yes stop_codon:yes gene_type:complete